MGMGEYQKIWKELMHKQSMIGSLRACPTDTAPAATYDKTISSNPARP